MAANYPKAWSVCELALLLSHGQASVEMGFSDSKKSGELPLVMKANALRRRAEEKQQEVEALDSEIAECLLATKQ